MCLPIDEPTSEHEKRCNFIEGYTNETIESAGNVVLVVMVIFMIVCCSATLIYYNYRYCKDNEPPFPVPDWCPNCLFPRVVFTRDVVTPGNPEKETEMKHPINPAGYYLYGDEQ